MLNLTSARYENVDQIFERSAFRSFEAFFEKALPSFSCRNCRTARSKLALAR